MLVVGSFGLSLCVASGAFADEPAPRPAAGLSEEEVNRRADAIASSIMSPFCPGRTVDSCPAAGAWREDIRRWTAEGVDSEEIKRRLHERVPNHDLMGIPKNRLGWALPIGLAIVAVGLLAFLLRYLVRPAARSAPSADTPSAEKAEPAKGEATPKAQRNEDWDSRLQEELETID